MKNTKTQMLVKNRIDETFYNLLQKGGKGLITYIMAGYPDRFATFEYMNALCKGGSDIIELGVPFSDPVADGPVIQRAAAASLAKGTDLDCIFDITENFRKFGAGKNTPVILMLYTNTVLKYQPDHFFNTAAKKGIDGVIIPDLPFCESQELREISKAHGIYLINLVTPSSEKRLEQIAENSEGFLYCVSSYGVTGIRENISENTSLYSRLKITCPNLPLAIGFGISTPLQAKCAVKDMDAVIIGSLLQKIIEDTAADNCACNKTALMLKEAANEFKTAISVNKSE